jgi:hypothetical protein
MFNGLTAKTKSCGASAAARTVLVTSFRRTDGVLSMKMCFIEDDGDDGMETEGSPLVGSSEINATMKIITIGGSGRCRFCNIVVLVVILLRSRYLKICRTFWCPSLLSSLLFAEKNCNKWPHGSGKKQRQSEE